MGSSFPAPEINVQTVVAAGDISCDERDRKNDCKADLTADLVREISPELIVALGDLQYESGTFRQFTKQYDKSWGAFKKITAPVLGNHEYGRRSAAGAYYRYFRNRQPGPPGYYFMDLADWRLYVLNSNCRQIDCDAQERWFEDVLNSDQHSCAMVAWHHPLFNSGIHGEAKFMKRFWRLAQQGGVDIALAGHEHAYERFEPMLADGSSSPERGMRAFTVGTGGKSLYRLKERSPGSEYWQNSDYGVLVFEVTAKSYAWSFVNTDGVVMDSGESRC